MKFYSFFYFSYFCTLSSWIKMEILPNTKIPRTKKPDWLRVKLPAGADYRQVRSVVDEHKLHTICQSGNCPNMGECWGAGTATFMILGNICTRSCGFCAVATGRPEAVDWNEPQHVAEAICLMKVKHAVITSVDRDDLQDGGAAVWHNTIKAVKTLTPNTTLETLIPDFKAEKENLQLIINARPDVVLHNIETVERITKQVRIQAKYHRSLDTLRILKEGGMRTKSGIMLGLGETKEEVIQAMQDLIGAGTDVLTLGQYLQPTPKHLPVARFVHPDEFAELREIGYQLGFDYVESSPLTRSSYHSERHVAQGFGRKEWLKEKENIKRQKYEELCQRATDLLKKYNPCKPRFINGKFYCARDTDDVSLNGCCIGCQYFKNTCSAVSLACKMWICKEAFEQLSFRERRGWMKEIKEINKLRLQEGIRLYFRASEEDTFLKRNLIAFDDLSSDWFLGRINLVDDDD